MRQKTLNQSFFYYKLIVGGLKKKIEFPKVLEQLHSNCVLQSTGWAPALGASHCAVVSSPDV